MAINATVQYNGEFLLNIILLTLCYQHQGTLVIPYIKSFCPHSQCSHLNVSTFPVDVEKV